MLKINNTC